MAKKNKEKQYTEAELLNTFGLTRNIGQHNNPMIGGIKGGASLWHN